MGTHKKLFVICAWEMMHIFPYVKKFLMWPVTFSIQVKKVPYTTKQIPYQITEVSIYAKKNKLTTCINLKFIAAASL